MKDTLHKGYFTCGVLYMKGTLHEHQYTFFMISHSFLLRMRNVSDKFVEKIKTHVLCSVSSFENRDVCEKMWKNIVERGRSQMKIWRMRIACWIPKATNTLRLCNIHCL
jgi:hypothetical protein